MDSNCLYNGGVVTFNCIPSLFQNALGWLLAFAGIAALFFIIFSGIKFVTSGGDAKQVEGARKTLTYAIIGLVIILLAGFILNIVSQITGVGCIKQFGFTNCNSPTSITSTPSPTQSGGGGGGGGGGSW